jgi:hypothetical protein
MKKIDFKKFQKDYSYFTNSDVNKFNNFFNKKNTENLFEENISSKNK